MKDNGPRNKNRKIVTRKHIAETLLIEIAWEVCNQVGGIYTVLRSKTPEATRTWGQNYLLAGPYFKGQASSEFDPITDAEEPAAIAVRRLQEKGFGAHYGVWLITGRPRVVLLDPESVRTLLPEIKYFLWEHHQISTPGDDELINKVLAFGYLVKLFLSEYSHLTDRPGRTLAHFHEWMAASCLPDIRREHIPVRTIFTTHATMPGRYLAMNDEQFYRNLPVVDWEKESRRYGIGPQVALERAAASNAHVFTTVSEVTAQECTYLLGRTPDVILPNGLNIERFVALHEFQNLHAVYKEKIHQLVMGHFFQCYPFDLDKTLYFFTSGRFEFRNKGFDLTLRALSRLNQLMREEHSEMTVVMFFITRQPFHSINPEVLQSRAGLEELRQVCAAIEKQVGSRMFYATAANKEERLPDLNKLVDDYWRLRYRRTLQSWRKDHLPKVVTHNLVNDAQDEILCAIRKENLINFEGDRVKMVYHPDFIASTSPLFGMDYGQFVRGCHLGIFPSFYEPWGYTPLECIAHGVPAITSDLSGFGDYVLKNIADPNESGLFVVKRQRQNFEDAAKQLARLMMDFVRLDRRQRIDQRNRVEASSVKFDWSQLYRHYHKAYRRGLG